MKTTLFCILSIILGIGCNSESQTEKIADKINTDSSVATDCDFVKERFENDKGNNSLKYYSFGITSADIKLVDYLKETYNITLISLGCLPSKEEICYNSIIDTFFRNSNHGIPLSEHIKQYIKSTKVSLSTKHSK